MGLIFGGTWVSQNKPLPGAYINFISTDGSFLTVGTRGVVACALPLSWGASDEIIRVTGQELLDGGSFSKIGITAFDMEESLPLRMLLNEASTALLYRLDTGGTAAVATIINDGSAAPVGDAIVGSSVVALADGDLLAASAKYTGTFGNSIVVSIKVNSRNSELFDVEVSAGGSIRETFTVATYGELQSVTSDYVIFTVAEAVVNDPLTPVAGVPLEGGSNGVVSANALSQYFSLLTYESFNVMTAYPMDSTMANALHAQTQIWREDLGKKVQCAVYSETNSFDYEGTILSNQGFYTVDGEEVDEIMFPLYVASVTAAAAVNQSRSFYTVSIADRIINPIEDQQDIVDNVAGGFFTLVTTPLRDIRIVTDVNSLITFSADKNQQFSKNQVIRVLDDIGNQVLETWLRNYAGQRANDETGRAVFKSDLVGYIRSLEQLGAIQNFDSQTDIIVTQGEAPDAVFCELAITPTQAMEKLYMNVIVQAA